jgi:hypothetical protein
LKSPAGMASSCDFQKGCMKILPDTCAAKPAHVCIRSCASMCPKLRRYAKIAAHVRSSVGTHFTNPAACLHPSGQTDLFNNSSHNMQCSISTHAYNSIIHHPMKTPLSFIRSHDQTASINEQWTILLIFNRSLLNFVIPVAFGQEFSFSVFSLYICRNLAFESS